MTYLYSIGAFSPASYIPENIKNYQTNECCRHETVKKINLLQYDYLRSESTTSPTTALIFKRTDVGANKYAPCLKCVTDDYKYVMLF